MSPKTILIIAVITTIILLIPLFIGHKKNKEIEISGEKRMIEIADSVYNSHKNSVNAKGEVAVYDSTSSKRLHTNQ